MGRIDISSQSPQSKSNTEEFWMLTYNEIEEMKIKPILKKFLKRTLFQLRYDNEGVSLPGIFASDCKAFLLKVQNHTEDIDYYRFIECMRNLHLMAIDKEISKGGKK